MATHEDILQFWFEATEPSRWWAKDSDFDALIAARFTDLHAAATRCELSAWRGTAAGRLAEIVVLDQFSRNMYRDSPAAFANDPLALAHEAVRAGADEHLTQTQRNFLYMPYMHSESLVIHDAGAVLFDDNGDARTIEFERRHRDIIARFGRYPHRNAIVGRPSTPEEIGFLREPGSTF